MFLTAWNNYNQEMIKRNLQKRYLNIDFLALYRINLATAYGKQKTCQNDLRINTVV